MTPGVNKLSFATFPVNVSSECVRKGKTENFRNIDVALAFESCLTHFQGGSILSAFKTNEPTNKQIENTYNMQQIQDHLRLTLFTTMKNCFE